MKIPKVEKLPSGNYFCRLRIDGKSIPITEPTKALCEAKAMAYKTGILATKKAAPAQLTLRAAIDKYIKDREGVLSPSTIRGYKYIEENRFQILMDRKLSENINWQSQISREAQLCSPKTIKNSWALIASVLRENGIEIPLVKLPEIPRNEHPYLEPEQIPVFVNDVKDKFCAVPALLALHSLRRSEILGLTWDNVDLKNGIIHVRGSLVYGVKNVPSKKKTNKNVASTRDIPIMIPELTELLNKVQNKTGNVTTVSPNAMFRGINDICDKNGYPRVGIHGLRHSFASLAYHLGLSELETMNLGGWSDNQTMRKIYTHLSLADKLKAQNKIMDFFSHSHEKNANENANENTKRLEPQAV